MSRRGRRAPGSQGRRTQTAWDRGDVSIRGRTDTVLSPAQRGETTDSGLIPPEVDWSDLRAYTCDACKDDCINWAVRD